MAQDLNQIISELDASYNPSRQTINDRINGLQPAQDADVAGLQAQQNDAFNDITNGARSRGMGFSGIPLQEQARYTASSFLPAVAKVKQSYSEGRNSLVDALNGLNIDQRKTAMSIRETQQDRDFQAEQARLTREASERASAAANSGSNALASLFGGSQAANPSAPKPQTDATQQNAYNDVATRIQQYGDKDLISDFNATARSAAKGNQRDKFKIDIYKSLRPDLFNNKGQEAISNFSKLTF